MDVEVSGLRTFTGASSCELCICASCYEVLWLHSTPDVFLLVELQEAQPTTTSFSHAQSLLQPFTSPSRPLSQRPAPPHLQSACFSHESHLRLSYHRLYQQLIISPCPFNLLSSFHIRPVRTRRIPAFGGVFSRDVSAAKLDQCF